MNLVKVCFVFLYFHAQIQGEAILTFVQRDIRGLYTVGRRRAPPRPCSSPVRHGHRATGSILDVAVRRQHVGIAVDTKGQRRRASPAVWRSAACCARRLLPDSSPLSLASGIEAGTAPKDLSANDNCTVPSKSGVSEILRRGQMCRAC